MRDNYNINSFFEFLGYYPSNYTPTCPGMRSLSIYVKGVRSELQKLLEPTPFLLADDRFVISIADFSNHSHFSYYDAAILLPVSINGVQGSTYYFEYEDNHETVASGREKWGYPKKFAHISLQEQADSVRGEVSLGGESIFSVDFTFDDGVSNAAWEDYQVYPHLQVRAISEVSGPSFTQFDVIARDTSKDYELISRRFGSAAVQLGEQIGLDGQALTVAEVLGGEFSIGNFSATLENGQARIITSLI